MLLSLLPVVMITITMLATFILRRSYLKRISAKTYGALLSGAVIMNTGFLIPFIQRLYGASGLARFAVIDTVNGIIIFSLVYAVVVKIGHDKPDNSYILKKLLLAPPLWALTLALLFKFSHLHLPTTINDTLSLLSSLVSPVILIALGLKFTLKVKNARLLAVPLALRFVLGGIIGMLFVRVAHLHGLTAQVAIFASLAPIGFNSITFSELEHLDTEFAASQVSVGLLIAIVLTPFLAHWL